MPYWLLILYVAQGLHPNKRKIETKYKLPLLNWVTIPATQIAGTVFNQLDDETVFKELDFTEFEETFKTKAQAGNHKGCMSLRKTCCVYICFVSQNSYR